MPAPVFSGAAHSPHPPHLRKQVELVIKNSILRDESSQSFGQTNTQQSGGFIKVSTLPEKSNIQTGVSNCCEVFGA